MKSSPHLTSAELDELRRELDRQLAKLERSMRATDESMRPVELDQSAVGRLSRIDSLQAQGLTRNLQAREQAQLGQIQSALRRMEEGGYGECTECDGPISFERLSIFPETPTCATCGAAA